VKGKVKSVVNDANHTEMQLSTAALVGQAPDDADKDLHICRETGDRASSTGTRTGKPNQKVRSEHEANSNINTKKQKRYKQHTGRHRYHAAPAGPTESRAHAQPTTTHRTTTKMTSTGAWRDVSTSGGPSRGGHRAGRQASARRQHPQPERQGGRTRTALTQQLDVKRRLHDYNG
jgi:hypothetical protein